MFDVIRAGVGSVNPFMQKVKSFYASKELLASFSKSRPCDENNTSRFKPEIAPILPFMTRITPDRVAGRLPRRLLQLNRDIDHSDQLATM